MHLSSFLVASGAVDASALLVALEEQGRRRPHLPSLMVRSGCLEVTEALKLCEEPCDTQGFLNLMVERGRLTNELLEQIWSHWQASVPPFDKLLVELGYLTESQRVSLVSDFEAARASNAGSR